MKTINYIRTAAVAAMAVLSMFWAGNVDAQVSFYPTTLSWTSEDTSAKIVTVYSSGAWTASHTGWELHFNVSPMTGVSGTEVTISPKSVNHTDEDKFEDLLFTDGSENTSIFRITHHSWENSFNVSPESLSWTAGETSVKHVSLHCPGGWTAFTDTPGYTVTPSSGAGDATLTVKPVAANTTGNVRDVTLTIRGSGNDSSERYVHITHGAAGSTVFETIASDDVSLNAYDPGITIPCTRSVSPSGGMTYNVPIATAAGLKNVPQLSLAYNSQGGEGLAGYGWELGGLSAITVSNKTVYYDGAMYAADADSENAVYSLDGVRLVPNSITNLSNTWQYETASGHVIVKKHTDAQGRALWFEAMYPNGSRATFGNSTATSPSVVYPVTLSRDRDGNWVRYSYASDPETDDLHLQRVEYGVAGYSQVQASIGLEYASRTDWHTRYMCGRTLGHSVMLKSVSSLNGADTLRKYKLVHEMREGANLLRRIRMTTPSTIAGQPAREAVPLRFGYGETGAVPAITLVGGNEMFLNSIFSPDDELVYVRGKFVPGSYTDGVFIYTKPENEDDENVSACFIPSLESSAMMRIGTISSKYDTIQAADIDGDGTDEIVAIKNPSGGSLFFFILGINAGGPYIKSFYNAGVADNNTTFQWGDYLGLGRTQTLAIGISQNRLGKYTARYKVVNNADGTYMSGTFYSEVTEAPGPFFTADLDGDGVSEACQLTNTGLDIWRVSSNGVFNKERTISGLTSSSLAYGRELMLTDLNADGYTDIVLAPRKGYPDTWIAHLFDGENFHATTWQGPLRVASGKDMFMDVDHDGLPDLVSVKKQRLSVYLNERGKIGRTYMEIDAPGLSAEGLVPCNVARLGAASSLMMFDVDFIKEYKVNVPMPERRHLRRFTNSADVRYETAYGYAAENDGYDPLPAYVPDADSGYFRTSFPGYVVKEDDAKISRTDPDSKRIESKRYSYAGATFNTRGLGFCGFRKTKTEDLLHPDTLTAVAVFNPEKRGVPVADSTFVGDTMIADRRYTYDSNYTTYGKLNPRLTQSVESDHLTGITVGNNYTYGSYDLPVRVATSRSVNGGDGTVDETTTQYTNSINSYQYILGIPTTVTETKGLLASKTEVTLNESMLPSRTRTYSGTVSGGVAAWHLASDRIVLYDECGNVTSERTSNYGATTYNETTYTYDAAGRYINSSTDALGRTTTYDEYNRYGHPEAVRNYLNQQTSSYDDVWGRPIGALHPDGTVESTAYAWSTSGEPGLYCVTKTVTGRPTTKAWYDALGREVCSAEQRFDGVWMRSFTEYDTRGRVSRKSLPLRDDAFGSFLWNTYEYDSYDRPVSFTEASGKQTSWSYSGTSTTTTKDGMSSISTTDAEGNVVSVTDGGGIITYALRDDGQPSGVTVTPQGSNQGVVTTFQYDAYGRRTAIIDPSAGTRTDSYTDNADGSSSVAHTGPNGTVTTSYDRFGRVTSVTRPEFSTSYTYGTALNSSSYGKLLSETSTNGTSRSFTYDAFGRTASETECADATHWLRKVYGYGAGSNIASIAYATQDGSITTEVYSYANGHNTGISLPDGTIVYTLTEESDMGQPTEVGTGGVSRSYAFTTAGIPSRRRILDACDNTVQDFEYSYAPLTGNMNWRRDNVLGYTESFSYDALNHLLSAHQTMTSADSLMSYRYDDAYMTYASNGNVTFRSNDGVLECFIDYNDGTDPYKATGNYAMGDIPDYVPEYGAIAVTSFDRPGGIMSGTGNYTTTFTYDAGGERTKMSRDEDAYGIHMDRYYLGGVYEKDDWRDGYTEAAERLFLGGSAYDAPMVLVKAASVNGGAWTPFNIGRDVQGSITEVMTADGEVIEQFRYDPWGLAIGYADIDTSAVAVDSLYFDETIIAADTLAALSPWQWVGKSVYVGGHGYTGHEHLPGFGLINCNARLYDPALGRFLMPDPLVQDPASTQNFNRYSYCLNNPLKYTDESGEVVGTILTAVLRGVASIFGSAYKAIEGGIDNGWKGAWDGFSGEWKQYGRRVANAAKIDWGLFRTDSHRTIAGQILSVVSRLSWELPQTVLGNVAGHFRNNFWRTNVEYYREATLINRYEKKTGNWGFTLGSYINGKNLEADPQLNDTFGHEYGHVKQSNALGVLYLPFVGVPSLIGSAFDGVWNHDHNNEWYEVWANKEANRYFMEIGDTTAAQKLVSGSNKLVRSKPDWYDYVIWIYYFLLCFGIGFI